MDTCTCTWVSIIFLDVSAFERGMKGPVNLALWLSGAQLFVCHSVFMGACFWLQSQSTLLFWFHSLDSWSTIMSLGTSSLLQGCQSLLRGMGARKIKKQFKSWVWGKEFRETCFCWFQILDNQMIPLDAGGHNTRQEFGFSLGAC